MEIMQIEQLKIRKLAFVKAANLVTYMNKYSYSMSENDREALDLFIKISEGLALPSGRYGNAIALALEINDYVVAEYLIENANRLRLDTNFVASELGFKNPWTLKEEYLFSQLTYDEDAMLKRCQKKTKMYNRFVLRNIWANKRLEKELSVTIEDKKVLNKL